MIWNVEPWLSELEENARSIDAALTELRGGEDAADFNLFFRIEKALLLSAFTIRKLHENGELSSHADDPLVSVTLYPVGADKKLIFGQFIMLFGSIFPHAVSDMPGSSHKKIELRQACNCIIHSRRVSYNHESCNDQYSFRIFKGSAENKLVKIEFDTWISIIRQVPNLLKRAE